MAPANRGSLPARARPMFGHVLMPKAVQVHAYASLPRIFARRTPSQPRTLFSHTWMRPADGAKRCSTFAGKVFGLKST